MDTKVVVVFLYYDSIQSHNVQLQVLFDADDGCNKTAYKKKRKYDFYII